MVNLAVASESSLEVEALGQICQQLLESVELGSLELSVFSPELHRLVWCSPRAPNMNVPLVTDAFKKTSATAHSAEVPDLRGTKCPSASQTADSLDQGLLFRRVGLKSSDRLDGGVRAASDIASDLSGEGTRTSTLR